MKESKTRLITQRICPKCGTELPANSAPALCPKCLLEQALPQESTGTPQDIMPSVPVRSGGLPAAGQQFGHYRIIRLLGGGGMGAVFEAEDLDSGRRIALKVLSHALDSPEARDRFFREGRLAASVNHPNSVYVFGTEEIAGTPVIAMELVPGGTLEERVRKNGPMPTSEAIDAMLQIIAGLEQAQGLGILHRDIKPSNCFVDVDGTVKIGDFGLSICTSLRTEPALTASGTFLGTPAFCPPEQLRGEELNARSDLYSVGATLFYLLTGRTPFEARNIVALIATVLEHPAPSPRQFSTKLPIGLDRVVRRCLEKQPHERFKNYAELAQALAPYSSSAPAPASLGLRFVAGVIDVIVLGALSLLVLLLTALDPMEMLNFASAQSWKWLAMMLVGIGMSLAYYSVLEGRWGAAVGKALWGLRIIGPQKGAPGSGRGLLRALIYVLLPMIPVWLITGGNPKNYLGQSGMTPFIPNLIFYGVLALLFSTARKRNGYAALQDLATQTRVIARVDLQARPALSATEAPPVGIESNPRIGPYYVIQAFDASGPQDAEQPADPNAGSSRWFLAYDLRLLRKVWIHTVASDSPPVCPAIRNLGRIGRLRWLTGRRTAEEQWDAYEALSGKPLLSLVATAQSASWQQARFWLIDLARELATAQKDGTLPQHLTLDRVWITGEGRVKLLDFPAPGLESVPPTAADSSPASDNHASCQRLLRQMANVALMNSLPQADKDPGELPLPLPLHARDWLKKISTGLKLDELVLALQPLLSKPATVSRQRRAAIVASCLLIPLIGVCTAIFGINLILQWETRYPGLFELNLVLQDRWVRQRNAGLILHFDVSGFLKHRIDSSTSGKNAGPSDPELSMFISSRYRSLITNNAAWGSALALSLIKGESRRFAEQSLIAYPNPSPQEVERVAKLMEPRLPKSDLSKIRKQPLFLVAVGHVFLTVYVGLPAVLAALLFRRGLVLLAAGVVFVRRDGRRASRGRLLWRSLLIWSSMVAVCLVTMKSVDNYQFWGGLLATALLFALTLVSLLLPKRGLADRLACTFPVPK